MSDTNPQSTLDEQAVDEYQAAREYAYNLHARIGPLPVLDHEEICEIFLAGAKFARQAAEQDVAELVAASNRFLTLVQVNEMTCSPAARAAQGHALVALNEALAKHLARGGAEQDREKFATDLASSFFEEKDVEL